MANFAFEGDVTSLTARQHQFISEVLEKRGYKDNKVVIETIGNADDINIADIKRITVEGTDGETFKMIAKVAPTAEMARATVVPLFVNEIIMYEEILPKLADFQKTGGINTEEMYQFPECYGILTETPNELILLEDLKVKNFEALHKLSTLSNERIKKVLKNLAIYHSLSLALKTKKPESFEDSSKKLNDTVADMLNSPTFGSYLLNVESTALVLLDHKYKNAVQNKLTQLPHSVGKVLKDQGILKHSVIIQGDVWTTNLMFRIQEDLQQECIMIDYQQSRMCNPVWDILSLIFNCTDHKTRMEQYNNWIDYYHLILEKSLFNFGIKVNFIYPRDQLDADLQRYSKLMFAMSLLIIYKMTATSEDAAKLKEIIENNDQDDTKTLAVILQEHNMESLISTKIKIEGLVDSCREFGYVE